LALAKTINICGNSGKVAMALSIRLLE